MHISSSYSKILGETNFHTREIPRSGSKAKDRKEEEEKRQKAWHTQARMAHASRLGQKKEKEKKTDVNNNGQAKHCKRHLGCRTQVAWAKIEDLFEFLFGCHADSLHIFEDLEERYC